MGDLEELLEEKKELKQKLIRTEGLHQNIKNRKGGGGDFLSQGRVGRHPKRN